MIRTTLFAFAIACEACTVSPPRFDLKPCPCADGYYCDEPNDVCVEGSAPGTGGGAGAPAIVVSALKPSWTTPHQIRWEWQVSGEAADFVRYELVTATSESDVTSRAGSAVIWTPELNPELGVFRLPHTGIGDPVTSTTTDGHAELAEVYARLSAIDTQQRVSVSSVASVRTTIGPQIDLPLFVDALETGQYLTPSATELGSSGGVDDSPCIELAMSCRASTCFEQPGISGIDPEWSAMSAGDFDTTAYLELAVRHDGATPSFWSQLRIAAQHSDGTTTHYGLGGFTIRSGDFRVYEIPLRVLRLDILPDGEPLTYAEVAQRLQQVTVGGDWASGATVRVDDIHLRW